MTDFAAARRNMVDGTIRTADVTDLRLLWAFQEVPRERFVPAASAALAEASRLKQEGAPGCLWQCPNGSCTAANRPCALVAIAQ